MESQRALVIFVCVAIYMLVCVVVGLWAMRRTHTTQDFFMAGRHLGILVTAIAYFSSTMSGFGFVGGPGLVYRMGISSLWMVIATSIGFCLSYYLLGKRLRMFAEMYEPISLPDVVAIRYGSRTTSLLAAVAILLGVLGYLGSQILAMATVLHSVLQSLGPEYELALEICAAISSGVLVFYCVTGGIIASVYTDVIQGLVMMVAAVLVLFAAISAVEGGFTGMSQTILRDDPEAISPWGTIGMFGCLSWYFLFVLGAAAQPHVVTKLMMTRHIDDARKTLPISVIGYGITALLWISIGLVMRTLVLQGNQAELNDADAAAPVFLQTYAHPVLAGLVFAGLLAAIMSTADSFLNIGTAAIVHDIPRALRGRSLPNELAWARVVTVLIAAAATVYALYLGDLVAILGAFGWSTFAAALVPVVAIGFNWTRATPLAANVAILSSLAVNFAIKVLDVQLPGGIDGGAVALLVSLLLFFALSFFGPQRKVDAEVEAVMNL